MTEEDKDFITSVMDEEIERFGGEYFCFHSPNELAGVLQEELEELEEAVAQVRDIFRSRLWREGVRRDNAEELSKATKDIHHACLVAAAEAFQAIAMIEKFEGAENTEGISWKID